MLPQQQFDRHFYSQKSFLLYFVTFLMVSNQACMVKCGNPGSNDRPAGVQEYPSSTTGDKDGLFTTTTEVAKEEDFLENVQDWLLVLPYLPVVILVIIVCICRGCGYKTLKRDTPLENVVVEEPPAYPVGSENLGQNISAMEYYPYSVWTIPDPAYEDVVDVDCVKIGEEEEPPAYDTLSFEAKEDKIV